MQRRQALENITYRNPSGLALLEEEHHEMQEIFARNEKELTEELTEHKNRITILENRIKILAESDIGFSILIVAMVRNFWTHKK